MKTISSSPHVHAKLTTPKAMLYVIFALLPSALWGVYLFGFSALLVLVISIASAVGVEYLLNRFSKEETIFDYSALLTGLLIGMNMPPKVPLFIPILASAFAIFVVKWTFGGLGANWMNPALGGRVFVFFSFTTLMSSFAVPRTLAANTVSSATILSSLKTAVSAGATGSSLSLLEEATLPLTDFALSLGSTLHINPYAVDAFFGNIAGCIGEVSAFLLILGGIFLIWKKVITWHIPVIYIGSFALLNWIFGGIPNGLGIFSGEILLPVFSGGLILGSFFMATDWVTTPTTIKGQVVFALGCGFFTFLIRNFGSLPEGTSLAIILMNIVTPTIERYMKPKKFGYVKPVKGANK